MRPTVCAAALLLFVGLFACNANAPSEGSILDLFPDGDTPGDGSGGPLDDLFGEDDDDCAIPCLFGTECVEGECIFPCDPPCADYEECFFGECVRPEGATCSPPCASDEICVGEDDFGVCAPADGCEPPCLEEETCLRSGACAPPGACADDGDCGDEQRCIGGACLDPVDPDDWTPPDAAGVVYRVRVSGVLFDRCCFDLNGDGVIDNALAGFDLVSSLFDGASTEELFDEALTSGDLGYAIDVRPGDEGRADVALLEASPDTDRDGESDSSQAERAQGQAEMYVLRSGFGSFGPLTQFPAARVEEDFLQTSESDLFVRFPGGALLSISDQPVRYHVQRARMEGVIYPESEGWRTVPLATAEQEEIDPAFVGLRFGGAIAAEDIVDVINAQVPDCVCVSDRAGDLLQLEREEGDLVLTCSERVNLQLCLDDEGPCGRLPLLCEALPDASALLPWDVDLDGDGLRDAASVGFLMDIAPTALVR